MPMTGLTRRTFRKATSGLAIAVSFAMLLSLFALSAGLYDLSKSRLEGSPGDLVVSTQGLDPTLRDSHQRSKGLLMDRANFSAAMPILTILGRIGIPHDGLGPISPAKDAAPTDALLRSVSVGMIGIVPEMTEPFIKDGMLSVRSEKLEIGGWFSESTDPFFDSGYTSGWTGEVILDETIMEENGLSIGSTIFVLGNDGAPRSSFVVVSSVGTSLTGGGIIGRLVGGVAIFHLSELQYATCDQGGDTPSDDHATGLYLKVDPLRKDPRSMREISEKLSLMFPGHMVSTEEGRLYRLQEEVLVFEIFSLAVGFCALLVGIMFLSTIMLIEQEERSSETALLRAIGLSKWSIYRGMLAETLLIAMAGAAVGSVPGILGSRLLEGYLRDLYGLDLAFVNPSAAVIMVSVIFLIVNVVVFSTIPGIFIMRMQIRPSLGRIAPR